MNSSASAALAAATTWSTVASGRPKAMLAHTVSENVRQAHAAGEKLFVDFPGDTFPFYDPAAGQVALNAELFVAVLGASGYLYAEAFGSQELQYWVTAHVHCFEVLGGCPAIVVPDNLRSAVTTPDRYEPDVNATFAEMAACYGVAIMPARAYKRRDKAKAEPGVLLAERWIIARLRGRKLTSLGEANAAIAACTAEINARPFQKLDGSRQELFVQAGRRCGRCRRCGMSWPPGGKPGSTLTTTSPRAGISTACRSGWPASRSTCGCRRPRWRCSTAGSGSPPTRTQCYAEKRGSTWRGRYPDADGRMRSTSGYPTRNKAVQAARAERARIETQAARQAEDAERAARGETTLAEWIAEIWPAWDIELTTRANYSAPIRLFILPAFGDRPLASLRRDEIDAWERALIDERGYSVEYIRGARRRLHTILADAVTAGRLQVNPATRQRGRGRKASRDRAHATAEKTWAAEDDAVLLAERCGLLTGEAEFIRVVLMAFTGLRWGETVGLQASYIRAPDRRRNHFYVRVEWQMIELNGKFYLAPPKDGSRRDVDIPRWLFDHLQRLVAPAVPLPARRRRHQRVRLRQAFVFLGAEAGHARRSNYPARVFRPAADGVYPAAKRRRGHHTSPWRVHCSHKPFPGIPVPMAGIHRLNAEQLADCCWAPLVPGLTPHGLRHGHQTAMRRDRVPRVLRRDRLGHGRSGDIADHYTHIDDEMIEEMLASQTRRWQAAITARARIDTSHDGGPRSAVPALDEWLAPFRERPGEIKLPSALPPARKRGGQ